MSLGNMGSPIFSGSPRGERRSRRQFASPQILARRKSPVRVDVRWLAGVVAIGVALAFPSGARAADKLTCVDAHARSQELRKANKFRDSRAQLLVCADESCPNLVRTDCVAWLSQIEERVPVVMIDARDADGRALTAVRVIVDGGRLIDSLDEPVVRLDSGQHQFRFEHDGSIPIDMNVSLREGEPRRTLLVKFVAARVANEVRRAAPTTPGPPLATAAPTPASSTRSVHPRAPILTGAVAVAALGSLTYFGVRGLQAADQLRDECSSSCAPARVAPVRTQLLVADISLATAVIMGGITAWFIWDNRRVTESDSIVSRTSAAVDADSIRLQYSGRF